MASKNLMKNIFIIGGTGYIGLNLIQHLIDNSDHNITVLARDSNKLSIDIKTNSKITILETKLSDFDNISSQIKTGNYDIILHLASTLVPSSNSDEFSKELQEIIIPTYNLLELLSKNQIKIIFVSSGGTIYRKSEKSLVESDFLEPINYYGQSKLLIELHIRFLNRTKDLPYIILRPSNVYGKNQRTNSNQGFIAVAISKVLKNEPIEIWGDGKVVRDFIDISDFIYIIDKIINSKIANETFNVGSSKGTTINQIVNLIEQILKIRIKVNYRPKRQIDIESVILNTKKINSYFAFKPKRLSIGVADFIKYIKNNI